MGKNAFTRSVLLIGVAATSLLLVSSAYAATPTFSAYATGNSDYVQVNVSGDDNSNVILFYLNTSSTLTENILGVTNSSGSFSEAISSSAIGVSAASPVYVTVNGQRSATITWPYSSTSSNTTLSLTQTSVTLTAGRSSVITANNTNGSSLFVSSNSTPSVANVSLSGNQVTITANTYGTTTVTVCLVNTPSACGSVTVSVPSAVSISFSQNNVIVPVSQSVPVTVSGGTGSYTISNNSDPSVIQSTISGSTVYLYSNQSSGSAIITVCSTDMSSCGIITATASSGSSSSSLSFSQQNPTLSLGQTMNVTVSGGSGTYYIASNSNTSIVEASLSSSTLTLYGNTAGSAVLNVCVSSGSCSTMTVTVVSSANQTTLNQTSLTLSPGQTTSVLISGGTSYYISSNSNQSAAYATIVNNNILNVSGVNAGVSNISVCQTSSQCATLSVTVSGSNGTSAAPQLSLVINVGQTLYLTFSGGSTPYSLSSNSGAIFKPELSGSTVSLYGVSVGNSSVNVCSANEACTTVSVYVISPNTVSASSSSAGSSTSSNYTFSSYLHPGVSGAAVTALQKRLTADGLYRGPITGYYGSLTTSAVEKYQAKYGIQQLGVVGPATRASLNSGK